MKNQKKLSTKTKKKLLLILSGVFIGAVNGFFGGGGGMLCVPFLEKNLKIENKKAHATSIAVMLPLSAISAIVYLLSNVISISDIGFTSVGTICGGVLGALLLCKLNPKVVRFLFAVIVLIAGVKMVAT